MKSPRYLLLLVTVAIVLAGVLASGCDDDEAEATTLPSATITARDYSFDAPDTIAGGRVAFNFQNEGQEEHHAQFVRLNDGVTVEQLVAALPQGEEVLLSMTTIASGPGATDPGGESEIILDLTEGSYLMLCFIASEDGVPHLAKGMLRPFQVSGGAAEASPLDLDGEVVLSDFSIAMPEVEAGEQIFRVTNNGPLPHEVVLMKLVEGSTLADVQAFVQGAAGPPPSIFLGGTSGIAPDGRAWVRFDMTPGTYVAICFIPDPPSGKSHIQLGILYTFTVD
ncbi:MAG: hypothetical protein AB7U18_01875 [Dehalococcoidia bacterium]